MTSRHYGRLANFAWYQGLWFMAVLGGSQGEALLFLLIGLHVVLVRQRFAELSLMVSAACLGAAFDGLLASAGFYVFEETPQGLPIPLWLAAIWMGFAGTLRYSMAFMVARPRLTTAAAAFFAPLTYLGAERLDAVDFAYGAVPAAVVVGLSWAVLTPMLLRLEALTRDAAIPSFLPFRIDDQKEV
jgi:hypothetical protein